MRNRRKPTRATKEIGLTAARAVQVPVDAADLAIVVPNLVHRHAAPKAIGANVSARPSAAPDRIEANKQGHPDVRMDADKTNLVFAEDLPVAATRVARQARHHADPNVIGANEPARHSAALDRIVGNKWDHHDARRDADKTNLVFAEDLRVATTRVGCQARRHAAQDVMGANDSVRHNAAPDRTVANKLVHPDDQMNGDQTKLVFAEHLRVATTRVACQGRRHAVLDAIRANVSARRHEARDRIAANKLVHPDVRMKGDQTKLVFAEDLGVATTVVCLAHHHVVPDVMGANDLARHGAAPPVPKPISNHAVNLQVVGTFVISVHHLAAVGMTVVTSDPVANSLSADTVVHQVRRNIVRATVMPLISDRRIEDMGLVTATSSRVANLQNVDEVAIPVR